MKGISLARKENVRAGGEGWDRVGRGKGRQGQNSWLGPVTFAEMSLSKLRNALKYLPHPGGPQEVTRTSAASGL